MDTRLSSAYQRGVAEREGWLALARRNSALTLPGLIPQDDGVRSRSAYDRPIPHNNLGAQGVNTLAAKMTLQMLPPSQPFFRLEVKPEARAEIDAALAEDNDAALQVSQELEGNLVDLENRLVREVGRDNVRSATSEAFKHLLVSGNVVIHIPESGNVSLIDIRNFVVKRDPAGNLLELVIKEQIAWVSLPPAVQEQLSAQKPDDDFKEMCIFTGVKRTSKNSFDVWQEIEDVEIEGRASYSDDKLPFIVLRGAESPGDHYGPAFVSDFEGDLIVLEGISKAIKEAAIASSMLIFGVDPQAPTGLEHQITKAQNGAAFRFRKDDVHAVQVNKLGDFNLAAQVGERAEQRLRQAFLLNSTRNAERVTAEEIRANFAELQQSLGGTFALLADTFQRPVLQRLMVRLKKRGGLAGIENALKEVEPILITGVDAIGRNSEAQNLLAYSQLLQQLVGPQQAFAIINPQEAAERAATATSVKKEGLILTNEDLQNQQAQAAVVEGGIRAAPQIAQAATGG